VPGAKKFFLKILKKGVDNARPAWYNKAMKGKETLQTRKDN